MSWTDAYWDILSNFYWTPRYLGLKSIPRKDWRVDGDWVMIPKDAVANSSGPLYTRARKFPELKSYLQGQEEILNHMFNLTFSIAADAVLTELLFQPLGFEYSGPIVRLGREIGARYGWPGENVTQQDGLFVSGQSIVGVELKLGSQSWPEQIAKYIALMVWEEAFGGEREDLGLLFLVPEESLPAHWSTIGLQGPMIDDSFLTRLDRRKLPKKILDLLDTRPIQVRSVISKLRLAVLSWNAFSQQISMLESRLTSRTAGDQTLVRLLSGLRVHIDVVGREPTQQRL